MKHSPLTIVAWLIIFWPYGLCLIFDNDKAAKAQRAENGAKEKRAR